MIAQIIARNAVTEKISTHLRDKANDTAEIIDGRIGAFMQFLEGIARMPIFRDTSATYRDKIDILKKETLYNNMFVEVAIVESNGNMHHTINKEILSVSDRDWFRLPMQGKKFVTEPFYSRATSNMIIVCSIPIYDNNGKVTDVLAVGILASWLSDQIDDIVVGKTGYCYILGSTGNTLAHKNEELVKNSSNAIELSKKDATLLELAKFQQHALGADTSEIGFYRYKDVKNISSFATVKTTDWTCIIVAPYDEFMGAIKMLTVSLYSVGIIVLLVAIAITFFVATSIVRPIKSTVSALQEIAMGEGDLTARLPLRGNDEVTELALYFNETIGKISSAIKAVDKNAHTMEEIGTELASNMTETASSVHEISSNIESVKAQALTQATSVTETASTIEEIIRTIKTLNGSIESQAASVSQSSSSIEEMVANIKNITGTLEKSDALIRDLGTATRDGKDILSTSNSVTTKIAEESGSLMEASNVIQHIASQTNLLAMNAAIEAAHAGEAGKGFAVVADEIRKLAEESSTQGKTITATLKSLSGEIEGLSSSSKVVETKFNAIFALAEEVREISARLTEAMREQENGSREVLTAIKDINQVTQEVSSGSAEMLRGSEGVAVEMQKLDGLTHVITDSMNEMAAGASQISNAVQEVAELSNKNKASIEGLVREVGRFKVS